MADNRRHVCGSVGGNIHRDRAATSHGDKLHLPIDGVLSLHPHWIHSDRDILALQSSRRRMGNARRHREETRRRGLSAGLAQEGVTVCS